MNQLPPLCALFFALCLLPASAIIDTNGNGYSDVAPQHLHMKSEMIWLNGKSDPKRFEEGNYNTMKNKEAFYAPLQ